MGVEGGYGYGGGLHPACALHDKVQQVRLHAHYAPAQAAHMLSRQIIYINIRQWEYVQNSSHALVLVCSQHLFQYWPVSHGLITQAREGIKSFAEVLSGY